MPNRPVVKPGDPVSFSGYSGIVQKLYEPVNNIHACWVVYLDHRGRTSACPINWNGREWYISDTDACTSARESDPYVWELKHEK
jgi:hypothetical protein